MSTPTISKDISVSHQSASTGPSPWQWPLQAHEVRTLEAEARPRWLKVEEGSLWLTQLESGIDRSDDVWLCAGDTFELPAGSSWVLEAWAPAQLSVLQQAGRASGHASSGSSPWHAWASKLGWLRASVLSAV